MAKRSPNSSSSERKFTVIGDPHATPKNLDKINKLFDIVEELGNTTVWLGDFLDTKEVIRGKCLNTIYSRISESKLDHIILVGNHDWFNLDCQEHSLEVLRSLPNVTLVDKFVNINDVNFIPYIHDRDKLRDALKKCKKDQPLFAHLEIKGFDFGNGYMCEEGITTRSLKKFSKVISGHFHKYQEKDNLVYLGTPFSHSFGESNQDKFIGVFTVNENKLYLIKSDFAQHRTINIDCSTGSVQEFKYDDKDYIRVIFNGTRDQVDWAKQTYNNWPEGTKFIEKLTDEFMNDVSIDETIDNVAKFKEWATNIKKLDEDTIKLGVSVMEAVRDK